MRALIVNDPHLSDRPPSIRTETYAEDILTKLRYTADIAEMGRVDAVVWSGDIFHIKAPTRTSHALVQQVADVIREYHRPVFIVPGNHDVQNDRLESLDRQPLGVLFKAGAYPLVGEVSVKVRTDTFTVRQSIFGIPWLADWKRDLPRYMELWRKSSATLMVAHAPIVPPGVTKPYEVIDAADWAAMMQPHKGDVAYGHMHDADGAYEVVNDILEWQAVFCNYGAVSRGSLHESSMTRVPTVALYSTERIPDAELLTLDNPLEATFRPIVVPYRPADEVFRLADKAIADDKTDRLDEFLESIGRTTLDSVSVEGVIHDLRERGTRKPVLDEVEECFEVTG
jgi:hypothetical protein